MFEIIKKICYLCRVKKTAMTAEQDAVFSELERKVERLITLYTASQEKCRDLTEELTLFRNENERLTRETQQVKKEIKQIQVAAALSGGEDRSQAEEAIDHLVREIDKCIALLNN